VEATKQKEEKRKNLSPRNRKACHSISIALLKCISNYPARNEIRCNLKLMEEEWGQES
jgi:sialic acid synthase SpsE